MLIISVLQYEYGAEMCRMSTSDVSGFGVFKRIALRTMKYTIYDMNKGRDSANAG